MKQSILVLAVLVLSACGKDAPPAPHLTMEQVCIARATTCGRRTEAEAEAVCGCYWHGDARTTNQNCNPPSDHFFISCDPTGTFN